MTTNAPNPVDGDVQALTESQREDVIRACRDTIKHASDFNELDVLMARVALAALTAERCGSLIQAVNPKTGSVNIFYRSRGIESIDPEEIAEWEMQEVEHLYTTPPAHLLRPVEFPGGFSPAIGDIFDRQAPVMRRDREEGNWLHKAVVAELLRSLGHEVKK